MDAFVEVVKEDGTQERFPIEGAQITVGKSGTAGVSIPAAAELELEHLLIAPRGKEGCWVSTSQGALTPTKYKGKAFNSGMVPWGAEFAIGSLRVRVTNKRGDKKGGKEGGVSPVIAIAGVLGIGICGYLLTQDTMSSLPEPPVEDAPILFGDLGDATCPPGSEARDLEYSAHSRGDRYRYNLRDGVSAVTLYDQARACYAAAGGEDASRVPEMTAAAATLRDQINADYAARRLRLHHAREVADWERVVIETTALLQLTEHLQEGEEEPHPFVDYLVRSRRIAQAQHEREADTRTAE